MLAKRLKAMSDDVFSYNVLLISTTQSITLSKGKRGKGKRVLYNFRGRGSPKLLHNVIRGGEGTIKLTFLALYNMWTVDGPI